MSDLDWRIYEENHKIHGPLNLILAQGQQSYFKTKCTAQTVCHAKFKRNTPHNHIL